MTVKAEKEIASVREILKTEEVNPVADSSFDLPPIEEIPIPPAPQASDLTPVSKAEKIVKKATESTAEKKDLPVVAILNKESSREQFKSALPAHMDVDRFIRSAISLCRSNDMIAQSCPRSVCTALISASELGLEVIPTLGQAYLVPYRNKSRNMYEAQLIIGYRGMIDLARRSDKISSIVSHAVYENDDFKFQYGLDEILYHVPNFTNKGKMIAVYAVAKLSDGGAQIEVMGIQDVNRIKGKAKSSKIWDSNFEEMAKKTVIRKLFKYLPISVEIQKAASIDEASDVEMASDIILEGE